MSTRSSLGELRSGESELSNAHDSVLGTTEHASVRAGLGGDELNKSGDTTRVDASKLVVGHSVGNVVVKEVGVLVKQLLVLSGDKESVNSVISGNTLPDKLLLARGAHGLVLGGIEVLKVLHVGALFTVRLSGILRKDVLSGGNSTSNKSKSGREFHHAKINF